MCATRLRIVFIGMLCVLTTIVGTEDIGDAAPTWKGLTPRSIQRGATVEWTLSISDLSNAKQLHFRDLGLKAEKVGENKFRVTSSDEVRLGRHLVWLETNDSLLGPQVIVVDTAPQVTKTLPCDASHTAMALPLPCVVEGKLDRAADVDWFRFTCDVPITLTVLANTVSLGSDAVLSMSLFDEDGRELMHSDDRTDEPFLHYQAAPGNYRLRVVERSYAKPERAYYRIQFRTGPVIHTVFPHVLRERTRDMGATVDIYGLAFPAVSPKTEQHGVSLTHLAATVANDDVTTTLPAPLHSSWHEHAVSLEAAGMRVVAECEFDPRAMRESSTGGENRSNAQPLDVPARVVGQFETRGDVDWYRFTAKQGESFSLSTRGETLGQRMDLHVAIHAANGKLLLALGDTPQPRGVPSEWKWSSLDASGDWKSPADGDFYIAVRDLHGGSLYGPQRVYELLLERALPSFAIAALLPQKSGATGLFAPPGTDVKVPLAVHRLHGFTHNIIVRPTSVCPGMDVQACEIQAKQAKSELIVKIADDAAPGLYELAMEAQADNEKSEQGGQWRHVMAPIVQPNGVHRDLRFIPILIPSRAPEKRQ